MPVIKSLYHCHTTAHRYVENILEELDQPGEWFLDTHAGLLYMWPNSTAAGGTAAQAGAAPALPPLVAGVHRGIVRLAGSQAAPVVGVSLLGLTFSHTGSTFMEAYEVTSGGDWSIHRDAGGRTGPECWCGAK